MFTGVINFEWIYADQIRYQNGQRHPAIYHRTAELNFEKKLFKCPKMCALASAAYTLKMNALITTGEQHLTNA